MIILQAKTVAPRQVVESSALWRAASGALVTGEVRKIRIPTAKAAELPVITQYMRDLSDEQLRGLNDSNIVVNLHFNSHHETQVAVSALRNALPSSSVGQADLLPLLIKELPLPLLLAKEQPVVQLLVV